MALFILEGKIKNRTNTKKNEIAQPAIKGFVFHLVSKPFLVVYVGGQRKSLTVAALLLTSQYARKGKAGGAFRVLL